MTTARIELLDEPLADELAASSLRDSSGRTLNFFRLIGHHPALTRRLGALGGLILRTGVAPPRLRELAILRVAASVDCEYEFAQHAEVARGCGIGDDVIEGLAVRTVDGIDLDDDDRWVIRLTDELLDDADPSDATVAHGLERFGNAILLELIVAIGTYRSIATLMNAADLALDPGIAEWPQIRARLAGRRRARSTNQDEGGTDA